MEEINSNYTKIPNDLLFSGNPHEIVLWGIIRHFETMDQGICNCSINTLAKYLQLSRVQTQRILSDMVTKKIISVTQKKGFNSQYRTICNFSSTIAENSNTDKISRCIKNDTTEKNVRGDISSMIQGDVSSMIHHNKTVYNKTDNNNIHNHNLKQDQNQERAGALSSIVSSFKNDDFIFSNYLDMFGDNIYPWSKCAPDRLYHYAKKKGYCMTLAEIYKFLLVIAAGAYYKDGIPVIVNDYDTLLEKWKNKQSEAGKKFSEENNLESVTYQHNRTAEKNNIPLQTVKIPYCNKGILEIRRYKPILAEKEISSYSGDYMEEIDFYPDGKEEKIQRWKKGF